MFEQLMNYFWSPIATNGSTKRKVRPATPQAVDQSLAKARIPESKTRAKFAEEVEKDYQFYLGKLALNAVIQSIPVTIEAPNDNPRAKALAANLTEVWDRQLPKMLECVGHGRVAFEKWYTYDRDAQIHALSGLDSLPYENTSLRTNPTTGAFDGVRIKVKDQQINLEPNQCWWLALDANPKEPHGRSRYTGAVRKVWQQRLKLEKNADLYMSKFALGQGKAWAPSEYPKRESDKGDIGEVTESGEPANPILDLKNIIQNMESGGITVLPGDMAPGGSTRLFDIDFATTRQDSTPIENDWKRLDAAALRALGIPERALTQDSDVGSMAMAEVHWRVLIYTAVGILEQIVASWNGNVVDYSTQINFVGGTVKLKATFVRPDPQQIGKISALVTQILASPTPSPLIVEGVLDFGKLLELANLPPGTDLVAKLQAVRDRLAAQASATATGPTGAFGGQQLKLSMSAANGPPIDSWEPFAERARNDAVALWQQIQSKLGDGPTAVARVSLHGPATGIREGPAASDPGGEAGGDNRSVEAASHAEVDNPGLDHAEHFVGADRQGN